VVSEKKEIDFFWSCTAKEHKSMDTNCRKGNSVRKNHLHSEGSKELEKGSSRKLQHLHCWWYSALDWTWP